MKKDIDFPKVENVGICAVRSDDGETWKVHLLNLHEEPLQNILVSTRGYGRKKDQEVKTSELRHFFEKVDANSSLQIELIPKELQGLNNQYWVSFYFKEQIFDKKFIFLPDTLLEKNLVDLPVLGQKGILII